MDLIKITCTRCNGSGKFSFNLTHGTMCYGCRGSGAIQVERKAHARKMAAKAKREAEHAATAAQREVLAAAVARELDAQFGPFTDDARGAEARVQACQRAFGKTPGDIVCERLLETA